jgi:hypothetical protein
MSVKCSEVGLEECLDILRWTKECLCMDCEVVECNLCSKYGCTKYPENMGRVDE